MGAHVQDGIVGEGNSPDVCCILKRICEAPKVSGTSSRAIKAFFPFLEMVLTLEIIPEFHWIYRCYQPLLGSSLPLPIFVKHVLGTFFVEPLVRGWGHTEASSTWVFTARSSQEAVWRSHPGEQPVGRDVQPSTLPTQTSFLLTSPRTNSSWITPDSGWVDTGLVPSQEPGLVEKTITSKLSWILKIHSDKYYRALLWASNSPLHSLVQVSVPLSEAPNAEYQKQCSYHLSSWALPL